MSRTHRLLLALLAGCAVIWLGQIAVALVLHVPGLVALLKWLRAQGIPMEFLNTLLLSYLPVTLVALLVGLVVFSALGKRVGLFLCATAPFVLYSMFMNTAAIGSAASLYDSRVWAAAATVPLGLLLALLMTRSRARF